MQLINMNKSIIFLKDYSNETWKRSQRNILIPLCRINAASEWWVVVAKCRRTDMEKVNKHWSCCWSIIKVYYMGNNLHFNSVLTDARDYFKSFVDVFLSGSRATKNNTPSKKVDPSRTLISLREWARCFERSLVAF